MLDNEEYTNNNVTTTDDKDEVDDDVGEIKNRRNLRIQRKSASDELIDENDDVDDVSIEIEAAAAPESETKATNSYAAKKTVAQGMMDIALITANANQLRYLIELNSKSPTYYLNFILIMISLGLQIAVGVSLVFKGRLDIRGKSKNKAAKRINNHVVVGIFLITIINIFIASFTTTTGNRL